MDDPDLTPNPALANMPPGTIMLDQLKTIDFVDCGELVGLFLDDHRKGPMIVPLTPTIARVLARNLNRVADLAEGGGRP